jgi:AAA+ superfamily predicted ATPase
MSMAYKQWADSGGVLVPTGSTINELPPGAYFFRNSPMVGLHAVGADLKEEELVVFDDSPVSSVMNHMDLFWKNRERYVDMGIPYYRGILMYGPPGTGKTVIAKLVANSIIARGGIAVVLESDNISVIQAFLPILRELELHRPMMVLMEDVEEIAEYTEHELLQLLDGAVAGKDGIVYLATTNNIGELPPRIRNRPSRFDILVPVGLPNADVRKQYIDHLLQNVRDKVHTNEYVVSDMVEKSNGFSLAHIKEMVISVVAFGLDLNTVIARLQAMGEIDKKAEADEEDAEGN